ncbi:uncharacterized protein SAPINGB_P001662 [Magnusiomyces paraingens]|uniref:UNC-45/Cro1/She4 central domain-containing protein n=1 Tax=Magnusiomyces paraingens TaxID=2606893 RepID=A0A5E8B6V0_9ASCO|nr:uncharacterized protein SAPINGB_P001662 [Saprochaete ingens]VVT47339.1 unnamed protein product [Saprochaete ingens]
MTSTSEITGDLAKLGISSKVSQIVKDSKSWEDLLKAVTIEIDASSDATFSDLVSGSYTFKDSKTPTPRSVLPRVVASSPTNRTAFVTFLDTRPDLVSLYADLVAKSDDSGDALAPVFPQLATKTQRKFLDVATGSLKGEKPGSKSSLAHLRIISSYFASPRLQKTTSDDDEIKYIKESRHKLLSLLAPYADRRLPPQWVSPVALVLVKLLELDYDGTTETVQSLVDDLLLVSGPSEANADSNLLIQAFSITSLLFHVDKDVGYSVFSSDAIAAQHKLFDTTAAKPSPLLASEDVVIAAMDLLSSACVHKEARNIVKERFLGMVKYAFELSGKTSVTVLAASVLVKTTYANAQPKIPGQKPQEDEDHIDLKTLSLVFEEQVEKTPYTKDETPEDHMAKFIYGTALEGLAFTSLKLDTKMRVVASSNILKNLVTVVKSTKEGPWVYCALSIFENVTTYAPKVTEEQKRVDKLKEYAEGGGKDGAKDENKQKHEPDSLVAIRCKKVLATDIVSVLATNSPSFTRAACNTTARLLRNLSTDKAQRGLFVQQGGLTVLLYLVLPKVEKKEVSWEDFRVDPREVVVATSGLARALISIDPKLAFGTKISPAVAIQPLVRQLSNAGNIGSSGRSVLDTPQQLSDIPLLDVFEALLALTNLASVDEKCAGLIVHIAWEKLEILLVSGNELVQRAAVELLCNLAASPQCAAKFFDPATKASGTSRLRLLAALADIDDLPVRLAATGAIAMLSEWGPAAVVPLRESEPIVDRLLQLLHEETDGGVMVRVLTALGNMLGNNDSVPADPKFFGRLQAEVPALQSVGARTGDGDAAELCSELVAVLR